jgi:SAM-dependent methyltransferase
VNLDFSYNIWLSKHSSLKKFLFKIGLLDEFQLKTQWPAFIKRWDVRKSLPFSDNSVDFVYCSHFIEHVEREEAIEILKECHRILKLGGIIRLVVPDLRLIVERYLAKDYEFFEAQEPQLLADSFISFLRLVEPKRRGISVRLKAFFDRKVAPFHRWMYDFGSLSLILESCGFEEIERKNFREGQVPDIQLLDSKPKESLFLEAKKIQATVNVGSRVPKR